MQRCCGGKGTSGFERTEGIMGKGDYLEYTETTPQEVKARSQLVLLQDYGPEHSSEENRTRVLVWKSQALT